MYWLGADWKTDAEETGQFLEQNSPIDWLIVDHYALDNRWEQTLRPLVGKVMVIDDLYNRPHHCDVLLDQNFSKHEGKYDDLVQDNCLQLLGPKYSMLREEFREARKHLNPRSGELRRLLVSFGGVDRTNQTKKVLEAVNLLKKPELKVDVVVGQANPNQSTLKQLISILPNACLHVQVENMSQLMQKADLSIGGGGTTTWERCCLGLPSLVITTAENQHPIAEALNEFGYLMHIGKAEETSVETILAYLKSFCGNPGFLKFLGKSALSLIDGNGIDRVTTKLLNY